MKRLSTQLTALLAVLLGCVARASAEPGGYGRPMDVSLDGHRSDWGFNFITIAIGICFVIMVIIIVWAMVMHREREGHKAVYTHGMGKRHLLLTAGLASAIFFGVDGTALVHAYEDITEAFFKFPTAQENPLTVEVYAQQWAWNFRFPGPDGKFGTPDDVVTLNDLRIPVGRPVYVKMKSKDVIHSFYLPNFRTKQDAVPGAITRISLQAKEQGRFQIGCAQRCGAKQPKMCASVTVTSQHDFERWLAERRSRLPQPSPKGAGG
jgi:cytochrome c oxidase subunit 2